MKNKKTKFVLKALLILVLLIAAEYANASNIEKTIKKIAIKHHLDPELFLAILAVESRLEITAVNHKTGDVGIGQINHKTATALKMDKKRLTTDLIYSLDMSATVLKWFKTKFGHETYWYCRYNVGTGKLVGTKKKNCLKYAQKVLDAYESNDELLKELAI